MTKKKTKRVLKLLLIVASITSLFFVPWTLVKAWILPLPDTIEEQMDEALAYDFEGMIVYIDQAGKAPQQYAAGWHNRETKTAAKPQALFKIASISKLYDAVALTKLVHEGRLSLDKTIADYLPELVGKIEYAKEITLRMMVQHRSGLPNFTDTPDFWSAPTASYEESLALILNKPADFKPDEDYAYCNTNYLILNKIMDNALGYDTFRFIKEEVLIPHNLSNTYNSVLDVAAEDIMSGYHVGHSSDLKMADPNISMVATAEDVGIFLRALHDGSVFKDEEKEIYASLYEFEHAGWVPGYQSFANYYEDMDAVVVQFYNTTDPKLINWNLSEIINKRLYKILKRQ